ncbi:hypothetical protein [Brevundimonas sp.]|uniref:hypothetical protein n=1 Tax=Brevundimonas sp. TaxID=1871086 RepID=UPI0025FAF0FC|nr:hypothetical protein [Brevundimonas sp.]
MLLAACGSSEVASPGEGGFGGGGGGSGGGGGGGGGGTVPADCPTGFSNVGLTNGLRTCQLPAVIIGNLVVPARTGTVYSLGGRTDVGRDLGPDPSAPLGTGAQGVLTVEPGVRIFGSSGADYIVVNRGSQIFAEGTATNPIIFTSRANIEGTTTGTSIGQWGGIVLLGRAPTASCPVGVTPPNINCTAQVEGTNAFYGGNTLADNSGRLRYVQIRYSGFEIAPGNELQALTLAGVGTGTTIEFVQSHNSSDDGIEIFGGRVNLRRIVVTGADDDSLDTDTGWRGAGQFIIIVQRDNGGDRGFEESSAGDNVNLNSRPQWSNVTLVHRNGGGDGIVLNTGTDATFLNTVVTVSPTGSTIACLDIDDAATVAAAPEFQSTYFSCPIAFRDDSNVNAAATSPFFTGGANNTANGTSTLTGVGGSPAIVNGANESAVTAINPVPYNAFFQNVTYIGAVQNASDTWWQGWTCGLQTGSSC